MSKGKYILVNGTFSLMEDYRISLQEMEALGFSERIRSIRSFFPYFRETLEMVKLKLLIFNQSFPEFTDKEGSELKRQMERSLTKNKHFLGAVLTLTLRFTEKKVHYTIQTEKLDTTGYDLNEKGLFVEIFDKIEKPIGQLSTLSIGSEIYWKLARNHQKGTLADQLLLLNTANQIVETPGSNLYTIKGKSIRGAGSGQGAYIDITRSVMLDIFSKLNLDYTEDEGISSIDIQECEELLIVNAIEGIRWVGGYEGKRYFNNTIRKISELFNQAKIN